MRMRSLIRTRQRTEIGNRDHNHPVSDGRSCVNYYNDDGAKGK